MQLARGRRGWSGAVATAQAARGLLLVAIAAAESPVALQKLTIRPAGAPLLEATLARSVHGSLQTTLVLGAVALLGDGYSAVTRAFNGSIPGPTLALYPGDSLSILFSNQLERPQGPSATNNYHHPNITNLHLHGLHVSPNAPSDDVLDVRLGPHDSYHYEYKILPDHSPGTYWVHPHHHGSQVQQTGAGAAGALLVLDPPGFLSPQLAALEDRVLVVQDLNSPLLQKAALISRDSMLRSSGWGASGSPDLLLVNGAPRPMVPARSGQWQRIRLVMAGPSAWLSLNFGQCDVALLAKDGVYISDFPRHVPRVMLPPGGRADVVVRCPGGADGRPEEYNVTAEPVKGKKVITGPLFSLRAEGGPALGPASEPLRPWAPPRRPTYLQDLTSVEAPDCSCLTSLGTGGNSRAFNGHLWGGPASYMHHSPRDAVVERLLVGVDKHTYHQHTWPFQLQNAPPGDDPYFKAGDWHDSYLSAQADSVRIRWRSADYQGPLVVHCHALAHSDQGMIAVELVGGHGQDHCACDLLNGPTALDAPPGGTQGPVLATGAALTFGAGLWLAVATGAAAVRAVAWARGEGQAARSYSALPAGPPAA